MKVQLLVALHSGLYLANAARLELARLRLRAALLGPLCIHVQVGGSPGHRTPISLLKRQDFGQVKLATHELVRRLGVEPSESIPDFGFTDRAGTLPAYLRQIGGPPETRTLLCNLARIARVPCPKPGYVGAVHAAVDCVVKSLRGVSSRHTQVRSDSHSFAAFIGNFALGTS